MLSDSLKLREDYWERFQLREQDIEFLYNYLLETEMPLTNQEMLDILVAERIRFENNELEKQRSEGCEIFYPKDKYHIGQILTFPVLNWRRGEVVALRDGNNPELGSFQVVQVELNGNDKREFAADLKDHFLNNPPKQEEEQEGLDVESVLSLYKVELIERLEEGLEENSDFVRIAGRWFPRALLVDISMGHLNLAEAILDMASGGPLSTTSILEQIELDTNVNPKLIEFSMDLALQEDERFDEVGAAGEVVWFLRKLEPKAVLETPLYLRHQLIDYDRSILTPDMLALESELDDELSQLEEIEAKREEAEICLIYPHWRVGTLPLSSRTRSLFPTAYEAPRIRFTIVDGETKDKFPAWVVRPKGYIYGLKEWYDKSGLIPGSMISIERSKNAGEVILHREHRRSSREWIRTVLVGSDGGIVFAMLKQVITSSIDERMAIAVPDVEALDLVWERMNKERPPFEKVVVNSVRELCKLNPQGHVHASELYSTVNVVRRSPPGPIMELLVSRPWFTHVGDLHFRFNDMDQ
jgi:hypothetical protein